MPVFIELVTDAFASTFQQKADEHAATHRAGVDRARRPLRGIEIKDDTYAFMKLVRSDGSEIKLIDSSAPDGTSTQYSNFILQSVQEARMEKHQIVETFGQPYIYFFGESPRFLDVQAVLVDSLDFNWYAEFWENYNRYFRGTRAVELNARVYLFYDDNVVEGYALMAQAQKNADQPYQARLSFRMYLTNYSNVTFVGDPNYPVRASVNLPPSVNLTSADAYQIGAAALDAAVQGQLAESRSIQAATGARQQATGFGGGEKLSDALRGGTTATGDPFTDGVLLNAFRALGNAGSRSSPLRSLISDNYDEFTALPPPPPIDNSPGAAVDDHDGEPEAQDFPTQATQRANQYGANINNPNMYSRMGFGPNFSQQNGFGMRGGSALSASFGVVGVGVGRAGGINGGLGFTGVFAAGARIGVGTSMLAPNPNSPYGSSPYDPRASAYSPFNPTFLEQQNLSRQFNSGVYGNGVPINQGIVQGTGVGGGIPGGMSGGIGPNGPGTLTQFSGGQGYTQPNGFGSGQGYGNGLSANGAVVNIPGAPSAFSTVAAPGTLYPNGNPNLPPPLGTASGGFFIGPNGASSATNTTGIFA